MQFYLATFVTLFLAISVQAQKLATIPLKDIAIPADVMKTIPAQDTTLAEKVSI